ncbi:Oidioi.mRNA.OKI2018_I69.chr1.g2108.t1.cds [Oikopleura dioica]|uniref:Oidioi.mRNA.OKI2018_I69.chr1.g2108.t1.cds n=1 Tax=Oikopleura dioica TaxID=34765 RepID=A0ABN7SQ14_OIKDI|nr:Oidioi.mRNA.OKI2018_I69.chr1.g2108.t1.cds [Oikopleura dioica]
MQKRRPHSPELYRFERSILNKTEWVSMLKRVSSYRSHLQDFSVLFGKTLEALSTELQQAEHQQQHSSFDNCSAELVQPLRQQANDEISIARIVDAEVTRFRLSEELWNAAHSSAAKKIGKLAVMHMFYATWSLDLLNRFPESSDGRSALENLLVGVSYFLENGFKGTLFDEQSHLTGSLESELQCIEIRACRFGNVSASDDPDGSGESNVGLPQAQSLLENDCGEFIEWEKENFAMILKISSFKECFEQINTAARRRELLCAGKTCWIEPGTRFEGDPQFYCSASQTVKTNGFGVFFCMILLLSFIQ